MPHQSDTRPLAVDPIMEGDRLLTAEAVAEIVGVRVDYIWTLCRRNEIPHLRFGRAKRFRRAAIRDWLEGREQGGRG